MDSPVVRRPRLQHPEEEEAMNTPLASCFVSEIRDETIDSRNVRKGKRVSTRFKLSLIAFVVVLCLMMFAVGVVLFGGFGLWVEDEPKLPPLFLVWLHALNTIDYEMIDYFLSPELFDYNITWSNPIATPKPVTCYDGGVMPSWFDIPEIPITLDSAKDEDGVRKAVRDVHSLIDKEIAAGTRPDHIFICGLGQGGALALASVLLYPRTIGGGAVIHGWFPFNPSILDKVTPEAKKTPILWSHGVHNKVVPLEIAKAGSLILEKAGMKCEFKAHPDVGQFIHEKDYNLMESWVKSCVQSSS